MSAHLIIVEKRSDFRWPDPEGRVITAEDYISLGAEAGPRPRKIINLCRNYGYLGLGYYCSLLAEARGDRVTPNVDTILELEQKTRQGSGFAALSTVVGELKDIPRPVMALSLSIVFGRSDDPALAELARRSFEMFRCPLLQIDLARIEGSAGWKVEAIRPLEPRDVDATRDDLFLDALERFTRRAWRPVAPSSGPRMDLAILHDPHDPLPPSRLKTLEAIIRVGRSMEIGVELIEKKDLSRLTQFDALFIRETTAIEHHTFRFARKAAAEGMPVIDDPVSIQRCTNKAFLAEILRGHRVATPRTRFVTRRSLARFEQELSYPVILKVPDGSFSRHVKKAETWSQFQDIARAMFKDSAVVLVQAFMYTPFDWRVGVLAGEPLFCARYYMCDDHWQILKHGTDGSHVEGRTQAVPVPEAPPEVIATAVRAANLVGQGLYGVDLKQTDAGVFVIEINDNPNIDLGMEDAILGDALYRRLLEHFLRRVEARHRIAAPPQGDGRRTQEERPAQEGHQPGALLIPQPPQLRAAAG